MEIAISCVLLFLLGHIHGRLVERTWWNVRLERIEKRYQFVDRNYVAQLERFWESEKFGPPGTV